MKTFEHKLKTQIIDLLEMDQNTLFAISDHITDNLNLRIDHEMIEDIMFKYGMSREESASIFTTILALVNRMSYVESYDQLEDLIPSDKAKKILFQELTTRLKTDKIQSKVEVFQKAVKLDLDKPNQFINAKIISDLRPVFTPGESFELAGLMINHQLRITYKKRELGQEKSFYFQLDGQALKQLRKEIQRAESKEEYYINKFSKDSETIIN
mgnify:CR=1 FL=1